LVGPRDGSLRRRDGKVTPNTAVCILLDVVLLGGAGSLWKAMICDFQAGICQSEVATALVARKILFSRLSSL
jgi:hypothetical protein